MNLQKRILISLFFSGILCLKVNAQDASLKTAENYYESLSYTRAIESFETVLKKKNLPDDQKVQAQIKLADSYYKIKDSQNAERVYADLVNASQLPASESASICLRYAQVLASNGKYKEAQEMYEKYNKKAGDDPRGKGFSKLYSDVSVLSKNASCYKVDYLSINTTAAEFSPSYFKKGMVFVSNRQNGTSAKRAFSWNGSPFLDLFYLDDISSVSPSTAGIGGSSESNTKQKSRKAPSLGSDDYTPITSNDNRTLGSYVGTNVLAGNGYGDKPITESERFSGSINSKYHEGPAAFFKDGSKVIFTRNNFINGKAQRSSDGINKLKLYTGQAAKDGWTNIEELPFNSDEYSTGHPALSPDEKLLFFSSDMPGGFGGTDIYVSKLEGNSWSAPINLGKKINSKGNEMFPFVDEKGNLYYSSDGLAGLGELDIFYAQLDGTEVKDDATNVGSPINSSKDDFGLITDGLRKSGYFSSNRKQGGADDDIYKFERECEDKEGCDLILAVYDSETKMPLENTKISFEDKNGAIQEKITDANGSLKLEGLTENLEFIFRATHEGYNANTVSFSTKDCENEASRLEIPLNQIKVIKDSSATVSSSQSALTQQSATSNTIASGSQSAISQSSNSSTFTGSSSMSSGNLCTIKGRVLAQGSKKAEDGVLVTLRNECDNSSQTAFTDAAGNFEFMAVEGCDYTLEGAKNNLGSKGKRIRKLSCKNGPILADIYMFGTGDIVEVENIYFDYGRCDLRNDARLELDKLVTMMRQYPKMRIELRSHTDSRSESDFNQKISEGRAQASANYLFKRGISRSRVEYAGYGESMPINGCVDGVECTEEQHAQNRRTEIKILQMN